jgi:surface antigen
MAADLARAVRPCPSTVSAPAAPVCWSMTEDTSAWTAQPAGSRYGWGQCTYYVGLMRPDIFNDRARPSVDPVADWDAWSWAGHAQAEGLAVDGDPRPGDVMVWSRQAVGNDTGHVAIVDAVGGTDPATGDLELTISEMNLDGLDNASLGQGDTMVLELPRSELVPGMVQFIHRRGPGYGGPSDPSLGVGGAALRHAVLHVTVVVRAMRGVRASAAQTSLQVH